jgi:hypothetical protein
VGPAVLTLYSTITYYPDNLKTARIFAFLSGPPNYGAGQLDTSEAQNAGKAGDADHILLQEQTSFYKNLVILRKD